MYVCYVWQGVVGMRLTCDVEVQDRGAPTVSVKRSTKPQRAQLAIGKSPPSNAVYIMICTAKDKAGTKYMVENIIHE